MITETNKHTGRMTCHFDDAVLDKRLTRMGYKPEPFREELSEGIELETDHAWWKETQ